MRRRDHSIYASSRTRLRTGVTTGRSMCGRMACIWRRAGREGGGSSLFCVWLEALADERACERSPCVSRGFVSVSVDRILSAVV